MVSVLDSDGPNSLLVKSSFAIDVSQSSIHQDFLFEPESIPGGSEVEALEI